MKKIMVSLMVAVSLIFVSDCFAQELVVAIRESDTIWTKTCQTCAWTQVPGNLKTATVVWEAGLNRFVLYGAKTGGQIWKCTFDRGGKFMNDWVQVDGTALWITGASVAGGNLERLALLRFYGANQTGIQFSVGNKPSGIAFDGEHIWVANNGSNNVTKLRANDGANLGTFGTGTAPSLIAFDGANIWVANNGGNVTKLRATDGVNLGTFPVGARPNGIAFDGANIWVANNGSNNVTKLRASDGAYIGTFAVGTGPMGIAFDGANIWVANSGSNNVTKYQVLVPTSSRTLPGSGPPPPSTFDVGNNPYGVAFDGANIWVANYGSNNVSKLRASDGANLGIFAAGSRPHGITFDGEHIWVANKGSNNVAKLRATDGAILGTFAAGTGPSEIAFDGTNIWVTNYTSGTVSKL